MSKRLFVVLIWTCLLLAPGLAACGPEPSPPFNPIQPTSAPTVVQPSPFIRPTSAPLISSPAPVPTIARNPTGSVVLAGIGAVARDVTRLPPFVAAALYDSLLHLAASDGSLEPALAESWQVSNDARLFTFKLRDGLKWSDGVPLTADDVVFTIKELSDPKTRLTPTADFGDIVDVQATDSQTVVIKLNEAYCAALTYISRVEILPRHVLEGKDLTSIAQEDFVGSGPLVLKVWGSDALSFAPNRNYYGPMPAIENWTYKIFDDEDAARSSLARGDVDVIESGSATQDEEGSPGLFSRPANQFYALAMNQTRPLFGDARVRRAILAGLDIAGLTREYGGEKAQTLQTSLLESFWAFPNGVGQQSFDLDTARQLLAEAGWRDTNGDGIADKDGAPLQMTLWAQAEDPVMEPLAFAIREQLGRIGVQVILKLDDRAGLLTRLLLQEYDLGLMLFNIPADPDQHWFWDSTEREPGSGLNISGYSNPRVDKLSRKGNQVTGCDPRLREQAYNEMYTQIAVDAPMAFLFAPSAGIDSRDGIRGIAPSPFAGDYWNLNEWQLSR